jgi:predicted nuclease of predicted toxin-antitoxin system
LKILFDQGVPAPLRTFLGEDSVETAFERGWQRLKNGELLKKAKEANYDIFITTDQNLKYQQVLEIRKISIIVLSTTSWPKIKLRTSLVSGAIDRAKANSFEEVSFNT